MADRPQLKATAHDVEDDDPFAELTRIMGFDPRVPAAAAAPKPRPVPVPQPVVQAPRLEPAHLPDDFSLDLERELMGEFGLVDDGPAPVARAMEPDPAVVPTGWFSRREESAAAPAAWRRPAEPEPQFQPYEVEAAREDEAQAVVAEDDYQSDDDRADDRYAQEREDDSGYREDDRRWAHEEAAPVYAGQDAPADQVDEGEYFEAEEAPRYEGEEAAYADEPAAPVAAPAYEYHAEPTAPAYDYRAETIAPAYDYRAETAPPAYDAEEEADVEAAVAASLEEEFALDTDWSDETDPVENLMPAAEPAPQPAAAPVAQDLAADFDAAMAAVDMDFRAVEAPRKMERATPRPLPQFQPQPVAKVAAPAPVEPATDLEDELNALLGKMRSAAHNVPAAAGTVYQRREPVDVVGAMVASQARVEPAYEERLSNPGEDNPFEEIFSDPEDVGEPRRAAAAAYAEVPAEPTAEQIENDPVNSLARMAARLRAANRGPARPVQAPARVAVPVAAPVARRDGRYDEDDTAKAVPDIETVDVEEAPVALADDLDLPEVAYEEERPAKGAYDDLDAEFSDLLADVGKTGRPPETQRAPVATSHAPVHAPLAARDGRVDNGSAYGYAAVAGSAAGDMLGRGIEARALAKPLAGDQAGQVFHPDELAGAHPAAAEQDFDLDLAFDPALEDEIALPAYAAEPQAQPRRRGLLVAGIVGGVALIGAIGAFALSFGTGSSSDVPVLVRADETPIKVKPENPGGVTVPNQDSKVYDSVAGGAATVDASQEKLVTTTEEPVSIAPDPGDLAADADLPLNPDSEMDGAAAVADGDQTGLDAAPAPKSEDRVEQATADDQTAPAEVAAVAPRKVRTLVVKPDGSLVPSGEAEVAGTDASADATGAVQDEPLEADGAPMEDPVVSVEAPEAETTTGAVAPVAEAPAADAAPADATASTPDSAPVVPTRPAEQRADAVTEVKPDQVAAIDPAPVPAGSWSVQIASQPTAESAQATWKDLARRYGSVIGDRQPSIVKAEIAGKGTFWRVRIPAGSRNEAVSLCESYKSAGGNCFVSR